jgi:hypothetical protein
LKYHGLAVKTDPRSEIVELIDDGAVAFVGAPNQPVAGAGTRRWIAPLAASLLLAAIAYGVVSSASKRATPPAPPVTTAAPPAASLPFLAADPPPSFGVHYAGLQKADYTAFLGYTYGLWATPGASATSGSWFSVTTYSGASTLSASNAYRVRTDRSTIAISHVRADQSVTKLVDDGVGISITSFGWSDDDLVRLAQSVRADGRTIEFADTWFLADHQLVTGVQPTPAAQGITAEQISYTSTDDPATNLVITVGKRLNDALGGSDRARATALRFMLADPTTFDVGGLHGVAGTVVGRDASMATWIDDANVVTVSAPMPVAQLVSIARTVHRVSADEWNEMKLTGLRFNSPRAAIVRPELPSIASGVDGSTQPWTIGVTMSFTGSQQVNWWWAGSGFSSVAQDSAAINTVVDDRRTYVLADLPRSVGVTARLEVTLGNAEPVAFPFVDAGPQMDRTFAAYTFSEATPYTAQIVADDGSVLASWPSA